MKTVEIERDVDCLSSPEVLWPLLANTARLNRMAGMAPLTITPIAGADSPRFLVSTRLDGLPITYVEEPFEWQAPERFSVRRLVTDGPLYALSVGLRLEPGATGGTRVHWRLTFVLKIEFLAPILQVIAGWRAAPFLTATRALDASARAVPVSPPATALSDVAARAASALEAAVEAEDRDTARRLVAFVTGAPDDDVTRIRPFELADRWSEPRGRVLTVCLEAVVAGLLRMHWDIVCPSCRVGASRVEHLYDLGDAGHCGYCDIRFGLPLDRAVEAVFQPAFVVRVIEPRPFCTGGPAATPHVLTQALLAAGGTARLRAPRAEGAFRVFVRGGASCALTVEPSAPASIEVEVTDDRMLPEAARVAPGGEVRVRQAGGVERHVKLEHSAWADRAATAHLLSLHPRFRRLFSGEVLGPGRQLQVARVAILFSDLSASTALYARVGDASAFRLVADHFDLLRREITEEGGVVVKTIGDAVMAAFPEEGAAVRAAVAMQVAWERFRSGHAVACDTRLKLGIHAGPAYVVTANGVLDYFGQTVNVAARLQGEAREAEIVVSDALADRAAEAGWLGAARVSERFDAVLKGLEEPVRAARVVV